MNQRSRKPKKPGYESTQITQILVEAVVAAYLLSEDNRQEHTSLQHVADTCHVNPLKARKILITADVYDSNLAEHIDV